MRGRDFQTRAIVTLLHNIRSRHGVARSAFVKLALSAMDPTSAARRRAQLTTELPRIVNTLIDELSSESEHQRRRFNILRRSDIAREDHTDIARDIGVSRSQFYRDLHEARELFVEALEDRLGMSGGTRFYGNAADSRFIAMETLRTTGQYDRACKMASTVAHDSDAVKAIRALCLRAEFETELGSFKDAQQTVCEAQALLVAIPDNRLRSLLGSECELVDFEAAHCQGAPARPAVRARLIDGLRRNYGKGDRDYASLLVKGLTAEASVLFQQDQHARALASIEEAASIVARERLVETRLAVDVKVRASGIHAVHADRVAAALDEAAEIVELGNRCGDVRSLRVGMQMMAAHLLTLGRYDEAKHYALEAWTLIDLFGSALDRVIVLSNLSRIELHRRDGAEALRWIRVAQGVACDAFIITQALAISEAEALVLVNQPDRAMDMIRAQNAFVREWPRLQGRAKLAETIALSALGRDRDARECSDQAVELSCGTGGPLLRLRALDLNVKLTGSARSRAALRDLQAALSTPRQ